jgi:hypothetical protein
MPGAGICTAPLCGRGQDRFMDFVAVLLGIVMFAVLYLLIFGIDRV